MGPIHVEIENVEWRPGSAKYGAAAVNEGNEIVQRAILSDRRKDGGGLGLLSKVSPPPGKVVKIVAIARSNEHVFNLEGGRATETLSLIICRRKPDESISFEVAEAAPALEMP